MKIQKMYELKVKDVRDANSKKFYENHYYEGGKFTKRYKQYYFINNGHINYACQIIAKGQEKKNRTYDIEVSVLDGMLNNSHGRHIMAMVNVRKKYFFIGTFYLSSSGDIHFVGKINEKEKEVVSIRRQAYNVKDFFKYVKEINNMV